MRFTLDYKEDYDFFKKVLEIINYDWKMDIFRIIKKINQVNKNIYKINIDCQNKYLEHLNNSRYNLT
jgi:spore coat polysaccharide biosynthesis protein SpsF (cytidylyltransferase family)